MMAMSVHSSWSSGRMWEVMTMVLPMSLSCSSNERSSYRARGSSPLAGSSRMRSSGSCTSARARLRRCFMPRESELTIESRFEVRSTSSRRPPTTSGHVERGSR